jgi:hypothetical protein
MMFPCNTPTLTTSLAKISFSLLGSSKGGGGEGLGASAIVGFLWIASLSNSYPVIDILTCIYLRIRKKKDKKEEG